MTLRRLHQNQNVQLHGVWDGVGLELYWRMPNSSHRHEYHNYSGCIRKELLFNHSSRLKSLYWRVVSWKSMVLSTIMYAVPLSYPTSFSTQTKPDLANDYTALEIYSPSYWRATHCQLSSETRINPIKEFLDLLCGQGLKRSLCHFYSSRVNKFCFQTHKNKLQFKHL